MEAKLIDYMGSDARVVDAARVSFFKESQNYTEEQNQGLIRFLARNNHWTPFAHVQITLREKVPIFVARQRFKHMVGFTYNEVSRRYVDDSPDFYTPDIWRSRPEGSVKQGSGEGVVTEISRPVLYARYGKKSELVERKEDIQTAYERIIRTSTLLYEDMLKAGVAPEQARMVLPQSMYTEYYCTGSLSAWARAYKLRVDSHAQKEIQDLAKQWGDIIGGIKELEHSWKALIE